MRDPNTTKWDYGHALLVAGSYGRCGCAILAARAALRSGCGLLSAHLPQRCVSPMQAALPEAMIDLDPHDEHFAHLPARLSQYDALAVGPGLGLHADTQQALLQLLQHRPATQPLILDADALNILSQHPEWLTLCRGAVITPHAREYQRLFGTASPAAMAQQHGIIIVGKAHHTRVYAPDGRLYENHTGNAAMATAGSGDVLTGMLAGILAQHPRADHFAAVCHAVHLHGMAGDLWTQRHSQSSLIASDLVEALCHLSTQMPTA